MKVVFVPDGVAGLVFDDFHFLININVCGQGMVRVVSGVKVGHTTSGNTKTSQH